MSDKYTRAQRRQIQRLGERIHSVTETDRQYFERFPHRQHRVRSASHCEIALSEIIHGKPVLLPDGCGVFTVVRDVEPGIRLRLFVHAIDGTEANLDEATARTIFESAAPPQFWEIEAEMRAWPRQ
jgi:hypothetical protein